VDFYFWLFAASGLFALIFSGPFAARRSLFGAPQAFLSF
jgi:hypothetical protein